jgi:hypothetical protein
MNIALGIIFRNDADMLALTTPAYAGAFTHKLILDFGGNPPVDATWTRICQTWADDYGAARNQLIAAARAQTPCEWLLMLDADEAMFADDIRSIDNWVKRQTGDAFYFPRINFVGSSFEYIPRFYPDYQTRLIRLASDVHYINRVHECSESTKPRQLSPYHIYHYGLCRPPEFIFNRWRDYARLQGQAAPDIMPADFAEYRELGRREPYTQPHPIGENPA